MSSKHENVVTFDTDSGPVGIDNRCTACISHVIQDFEEPPKLTNQVITGFTGRSSASVYSGTIKWRFADDTGAIHTFRIPNSFYVPDGRVRLLSPQPWAQEQRDSKPKEGTGSETQRHTCTLYWKQRRYQRTVQRDRRTNVFTFSFAPGYTKYHAFCATAGNPSNDESDPMTGNATLISNDEDSDNEDATAPPAPVQQQAKQSPEKGDSIPSKLIPLGGTPYPSATPIQFDLDGTTVATHDKTIPVVIQDDEEDRQPTNVAAEFLRVTLLTNKG